MDLYSEILKTLDLQGSLLFRTEFHPTFGVRVPAHRDAVRIHLVTRGEVCFDDIAGGDPTLMKRGDCAIIPHGRPHLLLSDIGADFICLDNVVKHSGFTDKGVLVHGVGDQGGASSLISGHLTFGADAGLLLFDGMPTSYVLRASDQLNLDWVEKAVEMLDAAHSQEKALGADLLAARVVEIFFIQFLRSISNGGVVRKGPLAAIGDPKLGRALLEFHKNPGDDWTVDKLASEAGLSRAAFASRFSQIMMMPPMRYVLIWRMSMAHRLLLRGKHSVGTIAEHAGYRSLPAFTRAFKDYCGVAPSQYAAHAAKNRVNDRSVTNLSD